MFHRYLLAVGFFLPSLALATFAAPQRTARAPKPACFDPEFPGWRLPAREPMDVEAADFDGDGDTDLAFAESTGTTIWFRRARRDYVFGQRLIGYGRLTRGDLDGDGDIDLVSCSNVVRVYRNSGSGSFPSASNYSTPPSPTRPLLGDLDGDGDLDLVVSASGTFGVRLNAGSGTFGASITYASGGNVALADYDGDGDLDVAAAILDASDVSLHENAGDGSFTLRGTTTGPAIKDLVAGDMNGDGTQDLIAEASSGSVHLLQNLGAWTFALSAAIPAGGSAGDLGAGDVDGDGDIDLAVHEHQDLCVIRNHGDGTFDLPERCPNGAFPAGFRFAQLDADDKMDIVSAGLHAHAVTLLEGRGDGTFLGAERHLLGRAIPFTYRIVAGRLDADARDDLVMLMDSGGGNALVAINAGSHDFIETEVPLNGASYVALGDLDGDADNDMVSSGADLSWLGNDGNGNFGSPTVLLSGQTFGGVAVSDMDRDGDQDLVVVFTQGSLGVLANQGGGLFAAPVERPVSSPNRVALGDLNLDGFPDAAATSGSSVTWFLNQGNGQLAPGQVVSLSVLNVIRSVDIGDVNGDGRADLVALDEGNSQAAFVHVLLQNAQGSFAGAEVHNVGPYGRQVIVRDLERDGDQDIVACCWDSDSVSILRNRGAGQLVHEQYPAGPSCFGVVDGDFDQDGQTDLATANETTPGPPTGGYTILYSRCR